MSSPVIKNSRRIVSSSGGSGGGGGGTVTSVNSGTDITVDNTDPANPIVNFTGTYQDPITVVANYSALPAVGTVTGQFYWCSASQGTKWLPGALGGTYYSAGMYYSNGVTWEFLDVPYNATQAEVNTGTNTDKFVTPATLASATTVIPSTGTTGDIISFSAANTPSRIAAVAAGSYLRSAGTSTLPVWSTLKLPNSATANYIPYATSSNTWGESANLQFNGTAFTLSNPTSAGGNTYLGGFGAPSKASGSSFFQIDCSGAVWSIHNPGTGQLNFYYGNSTGSLGGFLGIYFTYQGHFGALGSTTTPIIYGSSTSGANLTLYSTSNATKGKILFGTSAYDEVNNRLGIGQTTPTAAIHIKAGTSTASTAPLKFTSGTLLTSPEAGAMEFTTDNPTFTITTGAARKNFVLDDGTLFTSTYIPYATTNGRLTSSSALAFNGTILSLTTSTAGGSNNGLNIFNTSSTGQGNFYLSNDRAAFGAYGGFLMGGSAHAAYTFFGLANLADKLLMFSDGASSKGMYIGTTVNQSFGIGTNNIMRATITGAGLVTWSSAYHVLAAGTATASTSPLKFTSGTLNTSAEAGAMEYNNTFHLTNSDATRRHIVLAPNTTKVTAGAPYTNDGYVVMNIGGTDFKVMTTA